MKYSIITINYNHAEGLRRTIESVVNQTCKDYEYIIIDGGSTDGSVEIIKEFADKIDFWVSEPDNGIYNAMNKGISHAHGEYLNFMNSGDCFYAPTVLKDVYSLLTADIIFGKAQMTNGSIIGPDSKEITFYRMWIIGFNHQATFYKKSTFSHRKYSEEYKIMSDWKLTSELLVIDQCSYKVIDDLVALFDSNGISSCDRNLRMSEMEKITKSLLPKPLSDDYIRFGYMYSPLLDYITVLQNTYRIHLLTIRIVKILLFLSRLYKRLKQRNCH